jgi:hypothetical protein
MLAKVATLRSISASILQISFLQFGNRTIKLKRERERERERETRNFKVEPY